MKTELIDHSPTRKEIKIEIDAETARAEYERVCERYARLASVPGFRKGHAPASVVRQRYKKEIRGEAMQNLLPQAVQQAVNEYGLQVLGEPDVHFEDESALERFGQQPLSLHVHVEVLPEVELGRYKGLEAARRTRPVTDEEVERVLHDLREASAALQPVEDRGAEAGDTVTADFRGRYVDPPSAEDINVEDVEVELGGEGVVPEFTENLTGAREGDERTFRVKYPEDFKAQGLAGKEIEYTATVTAVRRKVLPELDDEWVKSLGEEGVETAEQLRERVRENLTGHAKFESDQRLRGDVMSRLVEAHQFEVPESLVAYQTRELMQSAMRDMLRRGVDPRREGVDWEQMGELFRPQAVHDLRGSLLLERVADAENIEVSDEEIEEEINRVARASRRPPEEVRAALTKQGGERSIADRLRHRKALDFIVDSATVRDEEWREEEPARAAEDEQGQTQPGESPTSAAAE